MKKYIAVLVTLAACRGAEVDLGGGHEDASPEEPVEAAAPPPAPPAGPVTPATCGYPTPSAACAYTGSCSDGSGYLIDTPAFCQDAAGLQASLTSVAQVAAALVGTWASCAQGVAVGNDFVRSLSRDAMGIEFSSDGHFKLLAQSTGSLQDLSLVPGTAAGDSGTFEVLDASASLGTGKYQVRLTAGDGGVNTAQVVAFASQPRLRFFTPAASDYMHAPTKQYQRNVCGPAFGPIDTPDDGAATLARMQGKWARCPNQTTGSVLEEFYGVGLEIPGDGTWFTLVEDSNGVLVRSTDPNSHGNVQVAGSSPPSIFFSEGSTGSAMVQPLLGTCGTLGFGSAGFDAGLPGSFFSYQYMHLAQ